MKNVAKYLKLQNYRYFLPIQTRWSDNDMYNHVNNSLYNHYFDTAINSYLIWFCGLHDQHKKATRFMVRSECQYRSPITYPETVLVGLCIKKIGNSSLHYQTAIFKPKKNYFLPPETNCDPLLKLSIGSQGYLVEHNQNSRDHLAVTEKISQFYESDAAALGYNVHVFTTEQGRPLKELPLNILNGCKLIFSAEESHPKL